MKRILLAGALSILMLGSVAFPVNAENSKFDVEYSQASTWTVSIPKTTLSQTTDVDQTVSAAAINIRLELKLQVKITGITNGQVTLTRSDGQSTTTSTVSYVDNNNTKNIISGDTVISEFVDQSTAFANNTTGKLSFSPIDENTKAGDYTGTITYVMETTNRN